MKRIGWIVVDDDGDVRLESLAETADFSKYLWLKGRGWEGSGFRCYHKTWREQIKERGVKCIPVFISAPAGAQQKDK